MTDKEKIDLLMVAMRDADTGMKEASKVMDLMGRGGAARELDIYANNLRAAINTVETTEA
jgi:hypothetical protein